MTINKHGRRRPKYQNATKKVIISHKLLLVRNEK